MPLVSPEEIKKIYLSSSADLPEDKKEYVVMDVSPLKGGDLASIEDYQNAMVVNIQICAGRIREWNIYDGVDEDNQPKLAEINKVNVARLSFGDLAHLVQEMNKGESETALPLAPNDNSAAT